MFSCKRAVYVASIQNVPKIKSKFFKLLTPSIILYVLSKYCLQTSVFFYVFAVLCAIEFNI